MDEPTRNIGTITKVPRRTLRRQACLVHLYPPGPALGQRFPLGAIPLLLGRDEKCDIRLDDEAVSRRHACIQPYHNGYLVVDLQSTNGTFVNDVRIPQGLLHNGDCLRIGAGMYRYLAGEHLDLEYQEEIQRLSVRDALTEVANKRYLQEFLSRALGDAIRYRAPLAVMLLELDRFAGIIAQLGQLGGDFTLRAAATRLKLSIRQEDLLARYDETVFALVLPGTHRAGASTLAERLRRLIESQPLRFEEVVYGVTLSLGVAVADGQDWLTSGELLDQARAQLRAACQRGGNCVVVG